MFDVSHNLKGSDCWKCDYSHLGHEPALSCERTPYPDVEKFYFPRIPTFKHFILDPKADGVCTPDSKADVLALVASKIELLR